jgi:hypothetical protein
MDFLASVMMLVAMLGAWLGRGIDPVVLMLAALVCAVLSLGRRKPL